MAQSSRIETVTLAQAKEIIRTMAHQHSILLLSGPGVGKSDAVYQAAAAALLPCRSLVGTQIAPEDVSGIPRIVGERSVFCPPRVLLPENPEPFCLFLDELPACTPDVQKAFSVTLNDHNFPEGSYRGRTGAIMLPAEIVEIVPVPDRDAGGLEGSVERSDDATKVCQEELEEQNWDAQAAPRGNGAR